MLPRAGGVRSLLLVAGGLLLLGAAVIAGYELYQDARITQLTERNLRTVAAIGRQLAGRIAGLQVLNETVGRSEYRPKQSAGDPPDASESLSDMEVVSSARLRRTTAAGGQTASTIDEPATVAMIRLERKRAYLYLDYEPRFDEEVWRDDASAVFLPDARETPRSDWCLTDGGGRRCVRIDLTALMEPLWRPSGFPGGDLSGVMLVTADGTVLARSGAGLDVGETLLPYLVTSAPAAPAAPTDGKPVAARPAIVLRTGAETARFAEAEHRLFVAQVPIVLPVAAAERPVGTADDRLLVVGVVSMPRLTAQVKEIRYGYQVALVLSFLLGILIWPVLRLMLLGPTERLNGRDVRLLVVLSIAATGCLAAAWLHQRSTGRLEARVDVDLAQLARLASGRLIRHVERAARELEWVNQQVIEARGTDGVALSIGDADELVWIDRKGAPAYRVEPMAAHAGGGLRRMRTPRATAADRQYFRDAIARRYWFPEERGCPEERIDGGHRPFTAEVVRSRTTGDVRIIVAQATGSTPEVTQTPHENDGVVLISVRPTPVADPVLPPGFGIAIIDASGEVQLHSDGNRSLAENLFAETGEEGELRAAVRARQRRNLDADYGGHRARFHLRPICGTPWTLVAYADAAAQEAALADRLLAWGPLFAMYLAAVFAGLLAVQIVDDAYRAPWLWPDRGVGGGTYGIAGVGLLVSAWFFWQDFSLAAGWSRLGVVLATPALLVSLLLLYFRASRGRDAIPSVGPGTGGAWERSVAVLAAVGSGALLAWVGCGVLLARLLAIALGVAVLGWIARQIPSTKRRESWLRLGHALVLLGLLVVCGLMPAVVLYEDAAAQADLDQTRLTQLHLVDGLVRRATVLRARHLERADPQNDALRERLSARIGRDSEVYPLGAVGRRVVEPDRTLTGRLLAHGLLWNGLTPEPRAMGVGLVPAALDHHVRRAGDEAWEWVRQTDQTERLVVRDGRVTALVGEPGSLALEDYAPAPVRVPSQTVHRASSIVGVTMSLLLALGIVWAIARMLFVLDADADDTSSTDVALGTWRFERNPTGTITARSLDLAEPRTTADVARWFAEAADVAVAAVRIEHLEESLDQPAMQSAILDGVRSLLSKRGHMPITIVSMVDPVDAAAERARDEASLADGDAPEAKKDATAAPAPAVRWSNLAAEWEHVLVTFTRRTDREVLNDLPASGQGASSDDDLEMRYRRLWRTCGIRERLVLRQLAEEGFVSHAATPVVSRLRKRRLLLRSPALSLRSTPFRRFVLGAESSQTIAEWEARGAGRFSRYRFLVVLALVLGLGFLFVTQRDFFNSTTAVATAVAGALPLLIRVFGLFGEDSASGRRTS